MNLGGHVGARKEKQKSQRKKKGKKRKKKEKGRSRRRGAPCRGLKKIGPTRGPSANPSPPPRWLIVNIGHRSSSLSLARRQVADRKHWLPFKLARCRSLAGGP